MKSMPRRTNFFGITVAVFEDDEKYRGSGGLVGILDERGLYYSPGAENLRALKQPEELYPALERASGALSSIIAWNHGGFRLPEAYWDEKSRIWRLHQPEFYEVQDCIRGLNLAAHEMKHHRAEWLQNEDYLSLEAARKSPQIMRAS
jgi:hypothetical protein